MAEYIPAGSLVLQGTATYWAEFSIYDKNKYLNINGKLSNNYIIDTIDILPSHQQIKIIFKKKPTQKQLNKLKKMYNVITCGIINNSKTFHHEGYIKHEIEKYRILSDDKKIRLWDIVKDAHGNLFEVSILENYPEIHCEICGEVYDHWEETETFLLKTKEEALKKFKGIK